LKKQLISEGKLDKYGRPNEKTPSSWSNNYVDYNGVKTEGASAPVKVEPISEATTTTASAPSNDHEEKPKGKKRKKSEADESSEQKDEKKEKKKKVWRHHPLFPPI